METTLAYDFSNTKSWGDMLYEEEQNRKQALLQMPQSEWTACVNAYFNRLKGNGAALISALAWAQQVAEERVAVAAPAAPAPVVDDDTRNWRVWMDMVEEPSKYGSDIGEWIEVDEEVRRGPKRWRVDAYWLVKLREMEEESATKIQSLWRGYITRYVVAPRFTCARCLKHGACPTEWDDAEWICPECTGEWNDALAALGEELEREAMGCDPEEMETCGDCGEEIELYGAKIGDLWLCAECIHSWDLCERCDCAKRLGSRCDCHCVECGDSLKGMGGGLGNFCSAECRLEYQRDAWKD